MPFLMTCDPALRDQCGAWKDPQAACACGWAPMSDESRTALALARAQLQSTRAHCCSHGVNLARGVCREMHETETTEETA